MNKTLMRAIAHRIQQYPERFDQRRYGDGRTVEIEDGKMCRSPACIAGWATALSGHCNTMSTGLERSRLIRQNARAALEITEAEAACLFFETWPAWWFEKAGIDTAKGPNERLQPLGKDAASILETMVDTDHVWNFDRKQNAGSDNGAAAANGGAADTTAPDPGQGSATTAT